jgi:hypothetical protein
MLGGPHQFGPGEPPGQPFRVVDQDGQVLGADPRSAIILGKLYPNSRSLTVDQSRCCCMANVSTNVSTSETATHLGGRKLLKMLVAGGRLELPTSGL